MIVYYLLVLIPATASAFYYVKKTEKKKNLVFFLFFFLWWLLLALRSQDIGVDLRNYQYYFDQYRTIPLKYLDSNCSEFGFVLLNKLIGLFTDNFSVYLAIIGFLTLYPLYTLYKKESTDPFLSIILLMNMSVFVMVFSGLRQSLAIAISILAFRCVKRKKLFAFLITTWLAMAFHRSAFVLLLMYPLYHFKITKKWLWFVTPSLLAVFAFNKPLFSFFTNFLGPTYIERYSEIQETGSYTMILLFALFLIFSYVMVDDKTLDAHTIGLRNFMILILAIQFFAPIQSIAMRMNYYFLIYIPLLIPRIIENSKPDLCFLAKTARTVIICFFAVYFFYNAYFGADVLQVFPYQFYWENIVANQFY